MLTPTRPSFDLILHFSLVPIVFLAQPFTKYGGGPKIQKVGHVTPSDFLGQILHFFRQCLL